MPPITAEHLNQLLDPKCWPYFTDLEYTEENDDSVRLLANVPASLEYFAGHFPEQAILPGVVQVHWVGELAKSLFALEGFRELKSIKFSSMVMPGQDITIELKYSVEKATVRFSYTSANEKLSSGMLSFGHADDASEVEL